MRLRIAGVVLALIISASAAQAQTRTWVGFQVGLSGGSPPPLYWREEPRVVLVEHVAVVEDARCEDDVFRYDNAWWRMRNGWWSRSPSWSGPWRAVDVRYVPQRVLYVPAARWKHHPHGGPPGQMKKRYGWDGPPGQERGEREKGHGRGHGDHDHD